MKALKIIYTTDTHGYVFPTDYTDNVEKPMGLLSIKDSIDKDHNTLLIDGGDTIQGSPFATFLHDQAKDASIMAKVMDAIGYDFVTLGNHDFNYGAHYLKSYLETLKSTVLCANLHYNANSDNVLPLFDDYRIISMPSGITVGLFGIVTDHINIWEKPETISPFIVSDPFQAAKEIVELLKTQVDLVIGIYHGGFEVDLDTGKVLSHTSENIAYQICEKLPIDLLLTGHQHMSIANRTLFGTQIVQASNNATEYAEILITQTEDRQFIYQTNLKPPSLIKDETPIKTALVTLEEYVQAWLDEPVGKIDIPLIPDSHLDMAISHPVLANFLNQIQRHVSGADISCTSLANEVSGMRDDMTMRDIISTYVYPNTLVVLEVTGEVLIKALEQSASYFEIKQGEICVSDAFLKPKIAHYNYDYFSGIHYTIDLTQPIGSRIQEVRYKDQLITSDARFKLVMNNYRASGAGDYDFYRNCPIIAEYAQTTAEMVADFIKSHHPITVDQTRYYKIIC